MPDAQLAERTAEAAEHSRVLLLARLGPCYVTVMVIVGDQAENLPLDVLRSRARKEYVPGPLSGVKLAASAVCP